MATATATKLGLAIKNKVDVLPSYVKRYLAIREQLDALESERRELEAEVIEWGLIQIGNGFTTGQLIAETDEKELLLSVRKATVKDLKSPRLDELKDSIASEHQLATKENQPIINDLMAQKQVLQDGIAELSQTTKGRALQEEYDELTEVLLGITTGKLGLMLRNKKPSS